MRGAQIMKAAYGRMVAGMQRRRTKRILDDLPEHLREDIGLPYGRSRT
jgi:hypothetical protein